MWQAKHYINDRLIYSTRKMVQINPISHWLGWSLYFIGIWAKCYITWLQCNVSERIWVCRRFFRQKGILIQSMIFTYLYSQNFFCKQYLANHSWLIASCRLHLTKNIYQLTFANCILQMPSCQFHLGSSIFHIASHKFHLENCIFSITSFLVYIAKCILQFAS